MTNEIKTSLDNFPQEAWSIRYRGDIPIPAPESLLYLEQMQTLDAPYLILHAQTSALVADIMANAIKQGNINKPHNEHIAIDNSLVNGINVAYRAPRLLADRAKKTDADHNSNEFMTGHDDLDIATLLASSNNLPLPVITGLLALQRERGFPHATVGPNNRYQQEGDIDWNVALTQLTSWQVGPGTIIPMKDRFEQLIDAHSGGSTSKALSVSELKGYRDWAYDRMRDFCSHIGIEYSEYDTWLQEQTFSLPGTPDNAQAISDEFVEALFDRKPSSGEYIPVSPTFQWLAYGIMSKKIGETLPGTNNRIRDMKELLPRLVSNPKLLERLTSQKSMYQLQLEISKVEDAYENSSLTSPIGVGDPSIFNRQSPLIEQLNAIKEQRA